MDRKLLCASLGLAESATDAEIAAKIETLNAKAAEAEEAKTKLADVKGEVVKLAQAQRDAQAKLEKIEKDAKTAAVKSAHAELVKEGRSQGAQFERFQKLADTLGLDEAKAIFGSFPKQNLSEGGISGEGAGTTETAQQQYTKLMDKFQTELKLSASDAAKKILREHREIALAATTRNDGRPVRA